MYNIKHILQNKRFLHDSLRSVPYEGSSVCRLKPQLLSNKYTGPNEKSELKETFQKAVFFQFHL